MENTKIKPDMLEVELRGPESLDVSIDKVYLGKGTDDRIPSAEEGDEGKVLTVTEAPDTFEWVEPEEQVWESGEGLNSVQVKNINARAIGEGSVAEGPESDAHAYGSHTEGYMTSTGTNADYSHAEGYKTTTQAPASHTEGDNTVANNASEHAEGRYNKSNMASETFGNAGNTLHSVGIGNASGQIPGGNRKNAFEIMQNGDAYLLNVGGYDGKNITEANTIQDTINNKVDEAPNDDKQYVRKNKDWAEVVIPEVPVQDVKVNGESVVVDRVAEVQVPTKTSDLTNDGADGVRPFVNESDVDSLIVAHNDSSSSHQDIRDAIPTKVSDLNNDLMFATYTEAQTIAQQEVAQHNKNTSSHQDIREAIPHNTSDLINDGDSGNPFVTMTEIDQQIGYHNNDNSAHSDIRNAIPTKVSQLQNDLNFSIVSETGYRIDLECDSATYEVVAKLYDKNNVLISTSTVIDLPIESLVVDIDFDEDTNELIITLKSGAVTRIPLGAIVRGLATQTWVQNYAYSKNDVYTKTEVNTALGDKVDKEDGKGL